MIGVSDAPGSAPTSAPHARLIVRHLLLIALATDQTSAPSTSRTSVSAALPGSPGQRHRDQLRESIFARIFAAVLPRCCPARRTMPAGKP